MNSAISPSMRHAISWCARLAEPLSRHYAYAADELRFQLRQVFVDMPLAAMPLSWLDAATLTLHWYCITITEDIIFIDEYWHYFSLLPLLTCHWYAIRHWPADQAPLAFSAATPKKTPEGWIAFASAFATPRRQAGHTPASRHAEAGQRQPAGQPLAGWSADILLKLAEYAISHCQLSLTPLLLASWPVAILEMPLITQLSLAIDTHCISTQGFTPAISFRSLLSHCI